MEFLFFTAADKALFVRNDAESAQWTVEDMSLVLVFPYAPDKVLMRGQRVGFTDETGVFQAFEVRKAESLEPDHYQRITAEHIAISELTDEHCPGAAYTDITAEAALTAQLVGTLWSVGNVTASGTSSADIGIGSKWQAVRTIEANWNVYITPRITYDAAGITGRYLDIAPAASTWRGLRLTLDKNADEVGVTYDDTGCLTAMYGYGASTAEAVHTVLPAMFTLDQSDHVMVMSSDSIAVNTDTGWDIYRYTLPQRMTIKVDGVVNGGVTGVVTAAYLYGDTLAALSEGATVTADALLVNCKKTTTTTPGTQQSLAPADFTELRYVGHKFAENGQGVPEVIADGDFDLMCVPQNAVETIRLDALTPNGNLSGVYPLFRERSGGYYALGTNDIGGSFESERLLLNRKKTVTQETGTQTTVTPSAFSRIYQNYAFMADSGGAPGVIAATGWDIYRLALTAGQVIRLDALALTSGFSSDVYSAGYEQGGVYIPLSASDAGTEIQADALIINAQRKSVISGGTWTTLALTPADFTGTAFANGALMQNGGLTYVQIADGWDIVKYDMGAHKAFKISSITANANLPGVVVAGYISDGVYYALPSGSTAAEFKADALVLNCKRGTPDYSATAITISRYNDDGQTLVSTWYSIQSATYTPNVRYITTYAYSMTSAVVTPLTVTLTREFSAEAITYEKSDGTQTGTASLTFGSVVWSTGDGDPANKPEGQEYIEDTAATAAFGRNGRPRFGYYQNGNVKDPALLLALTWQALQQSKAPKVSIDMLVRDLYRLGYADQPIRLHDMALVEVEPIGVTLGLEIIRLQTDLIDPTATRPTIGAYIPNIIYINRETAARASGGGGRGVGNGRGQTAAQKELSEFETEIAANNYQISLRAYQRDMDNVDEILRQAGLSIDANGVLTYAQDNANMWLSRLQVEADRIGLLVQGTGENAHIKAASIIAAINSDGSSVAISADKIKLNGDVSISGILTGQTKAYALRARILQADETFNYKGKNAVWRQFTFLGANQVPTTAWFLIQQN